MGLTRLNLEDRCITLGYGSGDRTRFQDFLNMSYRDVLGRHRWSWNRTTATVTLNAGANSATLDNDTYIYFGRLRPTTADIPEPEYVHWDNDRTNSWTQLAFDSTIRGAPSEYAILNDTIYFNTYADRAYTYEGNYWPLPTYLTADDSQPVIPDEDREVLVYGAMQLQKMRDNDWRGMEVYNQLYEGKIREMWTKDRTLNAETPARVLMPDHYGGIFD